MIDTIFLADLLGFFVGCALLSVVLWLWGLLLGDATKTQYRGGRRK